jgi:MFS transporter, DHA3 family, macrolide efflux protein
MRVLRLLSRPVPLALWLGQLISVTGDKLYAMAVLWLVLQLTGSATCMAGVLVAESIPYVVVGFAVAGFIRPWRRLSAMVRLDLLSAVLIAVVPVTYLLGIRSIWLLIVIAAAASAVEALFDPTLQSVLPDIVSRRDLRQMIALTDSTDRLARLLGPGCAVIFLMIVPEVHLFTFDAATFLGSAGALMFVARRVRLAAPSVIDVAASGSVLDGLREVIGQRTVRVGVIVRGSCNLVWPAFTIGLPLELTRCLHAGLESYGLLLGAYGLGNLAGILVSGHSSVGRHLLVVYCAAWSLVGVGFVTLALAPSLALALVSTVWMGLFMPIANVSMDTHIALVTRSENLARVYALQNVVNVGAAALGVFAVAFVIDATSVRTAMAAAGLCVILVGLVALARIRISPEAQPVRDRCQ